MALKSWLKAFRLRTLFLAVASICMGGFLAASNNHFNITIFILCLLTATFLQILSNLANDYGDYIHGADSVFRVGPKRTVQTGEISAASMKYAIGIFIVLSLITGLYLLYIGFHASPLNFFGFFMLGILAIVAALKYTTGDRPYGYSGLGDISVFIFFGWVAVLGTYYLQTLTVQSEILLPATTCGLFAMAVLNINNIRDIESDKLAGKKSIPVRIGYKKAKVYHWILLIGGVLCALIYTILKFQSIYQFVYLLTLPLIIRNGYMISTIENPADLNPYLKQMSISSMLFVLAFGIGLLFKPLFGI